MPNVRPLNKKKYGISKHAFGTAYSYCLQYPEWREELGSRTSTVKSPQITGMPGAHSGSDATANLAERRVELREKMQKVEDKVQSGLCIRAGENSQNQSDNRWNVTLYKCRRLEHILENI